MVRANSARRGFDAQALLFFAFSDVKLRAPAEAIEGFSKVVALEKEHKTEMEWCGRALPSKTSLTTADWLCALFGRSFKALTALVILHIQLGHAEAMVSRYRELLALIGSPRVTSNATMEAINGCAAFACGIHPDVVSNARVAAAFWTSLAWYL